MSTVTDRRCDERVAAAEAPGLRGDGLPCARREFRWKAGFLEEGANMTQVLLCAGPGLLVIQKDGLLFSRRRGQPDAPIPNAPGHYSVFLRSAKEKHGLTPVVGPAGEAAPCLPEEPAMPQLHREPLSTGEEVHRLVSSIDEPSGQEREERTSLPRTRDKAENVPR
jgi:hypothetical protein